MSHWAERLMMKNHLPRLVYAGPIGVRRDWHRWNHNFCRFPASCVYHLFGADGEVVYIGKTNCPLYRFEKHSRKPWWSEVAHLNLYVISCESHADEPCTYRLDSVAMHWEMKAIRDLQPPQNVVGVA
ncbi:hypothetical protein [Mycobacteroides abscessus]|uniref:hypothetical protein n=1 Tax=Mycobacteroides abscessus TaxID=36809 RepID=UPI000D9BE7C7|nr:hypothetical protein [Mycobacteroides abscessus]SPX87659.1 Uncharacterised protein [Mycobacteroides abscessus]